MRRQLLPAIRILLVLTVILGLAYPLAITGVALGLFEDEATGSTIEVDGTVVGSELLGQSFTGDQYFWPRGSAAGILASGSLDDEGRPADPNDLSNANSGGSNLGPTNEELLDQVAGLAQAYREAHGMAPDAPVPVDAVTSSGSGVDPHISVANARIQAGRVADARGIPVDAVLSLVDEYTEGPSLGFLGEEGVDVLRLNLALDRGEAG